MPGAEPFAVLDDLGRATMDWLELNFVIYHAAYRTIPQPKRVKLDRFEQTGRIDRVSDLADIPAQWGVSNVYADIGASFTFTVLTLPRLAAGTIVTLIKGLGPDKMLRGTNSVEYGSPQWQIEAFRRLQMPADLVDQFGLREIAPHKAAILGLDGARLYGLDQRNYRRFGIEAGAIETIVADWRARGGLRSNLAYGWTHRR